MTGVTSMEIARRCLDSKFLSNAIRSLNKVHVTSSTPLPLVSALLAQAEGSLGSRKKWERNLRLEWVSWPPGSIPALHFFLLLFGVFFFSFFHHHLYPRKQLY